MPTDPDLAEKIRVLADTSRADLLQQWRRLLKTEPPRHISRSLLAKAIAYALQVRRHGGLPPATRRQLQYVAAGAPTSKTERTKRLKTGVRLLRTWHGTTHEVIVTDAGFFCNGATYRSLSAVARAITGAKWNGRLFFGLARRGGGDG